MVVCVLLGIFVLSVILSLFSLYAIILVMVKYITDKYRSAAEYLFELTGYVSIFLSGCAIAGILLEVLKKKLICIL